MHALIGALALVVMAQYLVIAVVIVPRLAGLAEHGGRLIAVARWGAAAFFIGCAVTHAAIAADSFAPELLGGTMEHSRADGSTTAQLVTMVVPHLAQVIGGALFIGIARSRLEVSIQSKAAAQDRRALDRQWRSAFNDAPLGIALLPVDGTDAGGDAYVNAAYRRLFPLREDAAHEGATPLSALLSTDPEGCGEALARLRAGSPVEHEVRVDTPGGARLVHATLTPVVGEQGAVSRVTGIVEDVTERSLAAEELRSSEQRFRLLSEGLGVGVTLRAIEPPRFLYANSEYLRIVGLDADDLVTDVVPLLQRVHPDDRSRFDTDFWAPMTLGRTAMIEFRFVRPDGEVRWLRVVSNPISTNLVASTVEDITDRQHAAAAVMSAKAEAERANLAKSEFLSRMSHELRTPLNAVIGFGQLLKLGSLTPAQEESVTHILAGGRHLLGMIDDVLDISRIETDQLEVSLEPVLTAEVVEEAVALLRPMAADHGVRVEVGTAFGSGAEVVSADRRRLRQILLNLLSNAIKYNRPHGVARITCHAVDDRHVAISVSDTGIGIDEAARARLFTPFDRLGQETTEIEGTGIGLALTQRLVAIMGGRLDVDSEPGAGSTFTVVLAVETEPRLVDEDLPTTDAVATVTDDCWTLLYVEDNLPNVRLMQALVDRRPGWNLVHAGHGGLGLELATASPPDLVLLDLHLPDVTGLDVLRRLRADPRTAHLHVVVVSADANQHQVDRLLEAGADAYLTKPLDIGRVFALLDECAAAGSAAPGRVATASTPSAAPSTTTEVRDA